MIKTTLSLCAAALLSLALVGCGDDDDNPGTDAGPGSLDAGPGRADAGPGGSDAGPGAHDAGPGATDAGPGAQDAGVPACTNASDGPKLMSRFDGDGGISDPDGGAGSDVSTVAGRCGLGCISQPTEAAQAMCAKTCIIHNTGLSDGCGTCFGALVACGIQNCAAECASNPAAEACVACQCGANEGSVNCRALFSACSGLPNSCAR